MSETLPAQGTALDFDFWMGSWNVHNHRLRERLAGCDEWDEFAATVVARPIARPILDGMGNVRWEQALSDDGGHTWETNFVSEFTRAEHDR